MQVMTWGELVTMIIVGAIAWYGYVWWRYYRSNIFKRRKRGAPPVRWMRERTLQQNNTPQTSVHAQVHELMHELKQVFTAAAAEGLHQSQVLEAIKHRLQKCKHLPADIKASVNLHIVSEFSLRVRMTVDEAEINALW